MARGLYLWMGAGSFAVGVGVALAVGGSGIAYADSAGSGGAASSSVAHHQNRTPAPSHSLATRHVSSGSAKTTRRNTIAAAGLAEQDKEIAEQHKAIADQQTTFAHDAQVAVFDFTALPPEINSARLYSGAGSSSLLSAASAWNGLADELNSAAQGFDRAVDGLSAAKWAGPVSTVMASAAQPYVGWLSAAAAQAENAAAQASAAASAYETAFVQGVRPAEVVNRATLAQLTASNFFGGNVPAIVATEAFYAQMWAQDVGAMLNYHSASKS